MPPALLPILPIVLLVAPNVFMTTAWYGHLKFPSAPMWAAVMASWGIRPIAAGAFFVFKGPLR